MARVIKFEGRRVKVPDDATDDEVRAILTGSAPAAAAAPAAPSAAGVDPALAVPGTAVGTPYREPSLLDHILGGLSAAGGVAEQAIYGAGTGATNVLGLPGDLADIVPDGVPLIGQLKTVLPGGQDIQDFLGYDNRPAPEGPIETIANRVGEEFGATVPIVGGMATKAAQMGLPAIRKAGGVAKYLLEPYAVNPVSTIAKEAAMTTAAGTGAGIANLAVDRNTPAGQWADLGGAVTGAGAVSLGAHLLRSAGEIAGALFRPKGYVDNVVNEAVVDRVGKAAGLDDAGTGAPIDTDPLVEQIMAGQANGPSQVIPGFQESLADITGNPGIAALEYSRQTGPNAGAFIGQRSRNTQAVDDVMAAIAPTETPGAFRSALEAERDLRLRAAAGETGAAQSEFDRYLQSLAPTMLAEERGMAVRGGLENAERAAREAEAAMWEGINGQVDPAPLADILDEARDKLTMARHMSVADVDPTVDIPRRLAGQTFGEDFSAAKDALQSALAEITDPRVKKVTERALATSDLVPEDLFDLVDFLKQNGAVLPESAETAVGRLRTSAESLVPKQVDVQELNTMRTRLLDAQRAARSAGDRNRVEALGRYIDEINGYLDSDAVPADVRAKTDVARSVSKSVNETFNRPNDPIADVLAAKEGRPNVPNSAVAKKFVQPDAGQASNIDRLLAQTDLSSQAVSVRDAIKDEILAGAEKRFTNPDELEAYVNRFSRVFERFPDLKQEIIDAVGAAKKVGAAESAQSALETSVGTPTEKGRGTVGKYLTYEDGQSERAISEVLASKEPGKAADELLDFIGDNPKGVEGARAAFWQKLRTESQSADNSQRSMSGGRAWRGDWLKDFLAKPSTAAVADRLYRDNPEALATIQKYANVLANVDLKQRARATGTSGTAQGVSPILSVENVQSRVYAWKRGAVGGQWLVTSMAAVIARRAVRKAQTDAIERLTDKVLLNPQEAAILLKDNNPANRAALRRAAKGWLGNEASTLLDLIEGEDEPADQPAPADDPVVAEVMR